MIALLIPRESCCCGRSYDLLIMCPVLSLRQMFMLENRMQAIYSDEMGNFLGCIIIWQYAAASQKQPDIHTLSSIIECIVLITVVAWMHELISMHFQRLLNYVLQICSICFNCAGVAVFFNLRIATVLEDPII